MVRCRTCGIEAAVRSAPHAPLPVCADGKILGCAGSEFEAFSIRTRAGLRDDPGIDGFAALVLHEKWFAIGIASCYPGRGHASHVVQCACRRKEPGYYREEYQQMCKVRTAMPLPVSPSHCGLAGTVEKKQNGYEVYSKVRLRYTRCKGVSGLQVGAKDIKVPARSDQRRQNLVGTLATIQLAIWKERSCRIDISSWMQESHKLSEADTRPFNFLRC